MIEVLIALVILSVGLLATAAMQINALKNTNDVGVRTLASNLVMDMADKMHANYSYTLKDAASTPYDPQTNNCGSDTKCSDARAYYLAWVSQVQASLPDGQAIVCRDSDQELLTNDLDSDGSSTIDNNDNPCDLTHNNICDATGTSLAPYVIRVCWTSANGRRDVDGDGDIDDNDRLTNQIIINGGILHQFSVTLQ